MTDEERARALRHMDARFVVVDGLVFFADRAPSAAQWRDGLGPHQRDCNRRFVVADLLDEVGVVGWTAADLVALARAWAERLREALAAFAGRTFRVEAIGEEGAEDEPLEVCVTFYEG